MLGELIYGYADVVWGSNTSTFGSGRHAEGRVQRAGGGGDFRVQYRCSLLACGGFSVEHAQFFTRNKQKQSLNFGHDHAVYSP